MFRRADSPELKSVTLRRRESRNEYYLVIPAKAGIQNLSCFTGFPVKPGMTEILGEWRNHARLNFCACSARVVKLADTRRSGRRESNLMGVQISPRAQKFRRVKQTRTVQGRVGAISWRFKSSLAHKVIIV